MTKSNDGWVPEIGQVVMASWVDDDGDLMDTAVEVSAYRGEKAWVTCCGLDKVFHLSDIKFRPLKTEAEKRRDEQIDSIYKVLVRMQNDPSITSDQLYDEGCRILSENQFIATKLSDSFYHQMYAKYDVKHTHQLIREVEKEMGAPE